MTLAINEARSNDTQAVEVDELLHLMLESTDLGVCRVDGNGRCTYINRAGAEILDYHGDELIGSDWHGVVHPMQAHGSAMAGDDCAIRQAVCHGFAIRFEDEALWRKGGTSFPAEYTSYPIRSNRVGGAVITFSDITEKKRAEESQRRLAAERDMLLERLQMQIERMPLAYLQFDEHFRLQDWNSAAERIFGYTKAEVIGMGPPYEKIVPEISQEHVARVLTRLQGGDMAAHSVNENLTKDGRTITCEWFNTPLAVNGVFNGLVCLAQDITQRRLLEDGLVHSQKMDAVAQLAAGIAHDFNNFLTIIIGYSEMLLEALGDNAFAQNSLHEIRTAANRSAALTRQLLLFSRKHVYNPELLNLNDVLRDAEGMLRNAAGDEILLTTALDPSLGCIEADRVQLEQVLLNLVLNGRDAMPNGGRLTIETANVLLADKDAVAHPGLKPGAYIALTVTDTGSGMTEDVRSHLFEPFFTTKDQGKGTGLGLPVVHGVVAQSNGHIKVDSELGVGSSFTIYLPLADQAASMN